MAGARALLYRVRVCRPGYTISTQGTELGLLLRDGSFLPHHLVADDVLGPIRLMLLEMECNLSNEKQNSPSD